MKKALLKDSFKEITKTYKRFISIMLMAFLGVGFFAGIRAASPDMKQTIDNYYDEKNVYDIELVSTLGLTDSDLELITENEYVEEICGTKSQDVLMENENNTVYVINMSSIENINQVELIEGRLPQSADECVVEQSLLDDTSKTIGDTIVLEDDDEVFVNDTLTIVGVIQSPLYLSRDRGTSTLGTGKVNYYVYTVADEFDLDIYTYIYVKVKGATELLTGSDEYNELIDSALDSIKAYETEINTRRYDELITEAQEEIDKAQKELDEAREEGENELADAQSQIDDYTKEIEESLSTIQTERDTLDSTFLQYELQIAQGKVEIENAKVEFDYQTSIAQENIVNLQNYISSLEENISNIDNNILLLQENYNEMYYVLENPLDMDETQIEYLKSQLIYIDEQIETLEKTKIELNEQIYLLELQIVQINQQLQEAKNTIIESQVALLEQETELASSKQEAYAQLDEALVQINEAQETLAQNQAELDESKLEFEEEIQEAEAKLADAKEDVANIETAKLYILSRDDNSGYSGYIQDTESINNVGKVFPIIFFVIAILISLTSMTRMVEEQRQQIGTLKALGYTKFDISSKYLIYSSLATNIGGILGMTVGFYLLPKIVWMMYSMMYDIPNFVTEYNLEIGVTGLVCAFICIVGSTLYTCLKSLNEKPAILMRPKSPKIGKRVFLENIHFIWNKLDFITKVTVRNMFRYKKRFLLTIIGILGCTALIMVGFCLKDSISGIIDKQYGDIFSYDYILGLNTSLTEEEAESYADELLENNDIDKSITVYFTSSNVSYTEDTEEVQVIVANSNEELYSMINLLDLDGNRVTLDTDGVIISDKLAELLEVEVGDTIYIDDEVEARVDEIVENYVYHYMYMSKDTYEEIYDEEYKTNAVLIETNDNLSNTQKDNLLEEIMADTDVSSITDIETMKDTINDVMGCLKYVVWILIVASGMLAFVVLYNLANVNISERIRELATIKVLGFYDKEVYDYISKETTILTVLGIVLGIPVGIGLTKFILKVCEINILRFTITVNYLSILYSVLITVVFTIIVSIVTYFTLKKINMIESLKSVE